MSEEVEGQRLDCKEVLDSNFKSKDLKKTFSIAVSGFANADSGIILWGVTAKKNDDGIEEKLKSIDLAKNCSISSTQDRHDDASKQVRLLSGGRQNPTFESPRAKNKFPFAIVA